MLQRFYEFNLLHTLTYYAKFNSRKMLSDFLIGSFPSCYRDIRTRLTFNSEFYKLLFTVLILLNEIEERLFYIYLYIAWFSF